MSKDYPEVGDLWQDISTPEHIIRIDSIGKGYFPNEYLSDIERLVCTCYVLEEGILVRYTFGFIAVIKKYFKFIGKSTISPSDLFKVQPKEIGGSNE